ncbi:hypothetical protein FE257_002055 [Aspergillus nanangensis]|uniref:Uncharacterized protein n=1 Tax=Aspergillus nanangensis TaxID=2582783 RepID=A0AAD4CV12_ASPNN|nr:hypothetical protein FE257_002055 [Aspergillus nanangensis]
MPSFIALPPEILLHIADTLPHLHQVNTLSQTNHYLHSLLSPYLYRCALTHNHGQAFVTSCLRKNDPITRRLIQEATHLKNYWTQFHSHWKRWQTRALLRLLLAREQHHHPVNEPTSNNNSNNSNNYLDILASAIWNRDPLCVELLLEWHGAQLPSKPASLMHKAVDREEPRIVRLLIANGFPLDTPDAAGWTPLMTAVWRGRLASVQLLLEAGASVHAADVDKGWTPLAWALLQDRYYLQNILQADAQASVIQLLLEHGSDPNSRDKHGKSPLHLAVQGPTWGLAIAQRGPCWAAVRLLLEAGADFGAHEEAFRRVVFVTACEDGVDGVVEVLLQRYHDAVVFDAVLPSEALAVAARSGRVAVLETLLRWKADPNAKDQWEATPLMYALRDEIPNLLQIVRVLLEFGADPNAVADWLETPLQRALSENEGDLLRLLLEHGLDLAHYDTPIKNKILHEAVNSSHRVVVKMLLDIGLDLDSLVGESPQTLWRPLGARGETDRCCTQPRTVS